MDQNNNEIQAVNDFYEVQNLYELQNSILERLKSEQRTLSNELKEKIYESNILILKKIEEDLNSNKKYKEVIRLFEINYTSWSSLESFQKLGRKTLSDFLYNTYRNFSYNYLNKLDREVWKNTIGDPSEIENIIDEVLRKKVIGSPLKEISLNDTDIESLNKKIVPKHEFSTELGLNPQFCQVEVSTINQDWFIYDGATKKRYALEKQNDQDIFYLYNAKRGYGLKPYRILENGNKGRLRALLKRALYFTAVDYLRKRERKKNKTYVSDYDLKNDKEAFLENDLILLLKQKILKRLKILPEKQKRAILLYDGFKNLKYSKIAEIMRTSAENARKVVSRGRKTLITGVFEELSEAKNAKEIRLWIPIISSAIQETLSDFINEPSKEILKNERYEEIIEQYLNSSKNGELNGEK